MMTGALLNAIGILTGGLLGLMLKRQFTAQAQLAWRGIMGFVTVVVGLRLTWVSIHGIAFSCFKQIVVMLLAMMLGKALGRLLHIQFFMNRIGRFASHKFATSKPTDPNRLSDGFLTCTMLFCAGPLGLIGSVQDGLMGYWQSLAVKMVMDGLAAMGFVSIFGWGVVLSALPVLVYQGGVTLAVQNLEPFLRANDLIDSINAVGGMLVFCVALIILELKKIELADYLPSLVLAPLITYYWH
jgi:uncharacterized membrane protein YqgA involved in biofilm formation